MDSIIFKVVDMAVQLYLKKYDIHHDSGYWFLFLCDDKQVKIHEFM